jgi:hypothetical protein
MGTGLSCAPSRCCRTRTGGRARCRGSGCTTARGSGPGPRRPTASRACSPRSSAGSRTSPARGSRSRHAAATTATRRSWPRQSPLRAGSRWRWGSQSPSTRRRTTRACSLARAQWMVYVCTGLLVLAIFFLYFFFSPFFLTIASFVFLCFLTTVLERGAAVRGGKCRGPERAAAALP